MNVQRDEWNRKSKTTLSSRWKLTSNTLNSVGRKMDYSMAAVGKVGCLPKLILEGSDLHINYATLEVLEETWVSFINKCIYIKIYTK